MPSPEIRFVYFDLGNILVSFNREAACQNLAALFKSPETAADGVTSEDILLADHVLHSGLHNRLETGLISESEFVQTIREGFAPATTAKDETAFLHAISDMFTPIHSMRDVLSRVRQTGMPIGILSNTCEAHWSWVNSQDYAVMEGPFDFRVLSYEAKSMKPDPMIYREAEVLVEQKFDVPPNQLLFLDDREENVVAARQHGWNAELCLGGPTAEEVLVRYGVLSHRMLVENEMEVGS